MRRGLIIVIALIMGTINVFSQAFEKIPIERKGKEFSFSLNNEPYKAYSGINSESRRPNITFNGKKNFVYTSTFQESELAFEIFSNPKYKISFLLINNYYDYSLGADLYIINDNNFSYAGKLKVGAYNKVGGDKKMNYNSILPYISIVNTTEKTYFSFEIPFLVLNPGEQNERIVEGNKIHYTLINGGLNLNIEE